MRAASSSSPGILLWKNVRAIMRLYTLTQPGSVITHMVSSIPNALYIRYVGTMPPPKNIVIVKSIIIGPRSMVSLRESAYAAGMVTSRCAATPTSAYTIVLR